MKFYTGVGSRNTPQNILYIMQNLARKLDQQGWILRSGGANGADSNFEAGSEASKSEIYIPWNGYNNRYKDWAPDQYLIPSGELLERAMTMMETIHPNWGARTQGSRKLHARNVFQVLGRDLQSPSKMLICWAKTDRQGNLQGGTATAWKLARRLDIPCFNLGNPVHLERIINFTGE